MTTASRRDELAANLKRVQARVTEAAVTAGRDPADVTLIVVTKTFPASDIRLLHELGVRDIGENRHPDAAEKAAELHDLEITWHFIGQVQSNKAVKIASYADVVHSVDSLRTAERLCLGAEKHGRLVDCLIQVNLDPQGEDGGRGGVAPTDVANLAAVVEGTAGLRLRGLMGVAPVSGSPEVAFGRLAEIGRELLIEHSGATLLSMGMSGDFPAAIGAGATHVRVGSAVVGQRAPLR